MSETTQQTQPTNSTQETQKAWEFSPRANITALESAHIAFLFATKTQVKELAEHPSWPLVGRHFEAREVPVSVETAGAKQAQEHDGNAEAQG